MASPLRRQVRSEARLRYGQPLSDLLSARHTAHHQYQNDVATAEAVGKATKRAAQLSIPQLAAIYNEADRATKDASHQIEIAAGGGSPSSVLAMALKGESGAAQAKVASAKAMAEAEAVQRASDAVAGVAYAKKNALENYRATRSDLMSQTRGLHSQIGEFSASRLGELEQAQSDAQYKAQQDAQAQANSDRTYGLAVAELLKINPLTGKPLPRSATRSPSEQRQINKDSAAAKDAITSAQTWIGRLKQGNSIQKAVALLKTGGSLPVPTGQTDSSGQPKVHYVPVPKVPSDFIRAAVELDGRGYLSKTTVHTLRSRGIHVPKHWLTPTTPAGARKALTRSVGKGVRQIAGELHLGG